MFNVKKIECIEKNRATRQRILIEFPGHFHVSALAELKSIPGKDFN